jgi:hypothetical protein
MAKTRSFTTETLMFADKMVVNSIFGLMDAVALLDFVSNQRNCIHKLQHGMEQVRDHIRKEHPWLADVPDLDHVASRADLHAFVREQIGRFGVSHLVTQMKPGTYDDFDPFHAEQEMAQLDADQERKAAARHTLNVPGGPEIDVSDAIATLTRGGSVTIADLFGEEDDTK